MSNALKTEPTSMGPGSLTSTAGVAFRSSYKKLPPIFIGGDYSSFHAHNDIKWLAVTVLFYGKTRAIQGIDRLQKIRRLNT